MNALLALVKKDLILYFSNRRALLVTVAAPIAIATFFGSLFGDSKDAERARVPIAMIDLDQSATSRKIVAAMTADATFDVQPRDATDGVAAVRRGKLRAVVTLPAHFGEQAPRALLSARETDDRHHVRPVAGDHAAGRAGPARAARDGSRDAERVLVEWWRLGHHFRRA